MAGTANNFRITGRVLGPGILWAGLAIPAAAARLTLATVDADGFITPDATANPNAYAVGATAGGFECIANSTRKDFGVDEIFADVDTRIERVDMSIKADIIGIADEKVTQLAGAGFITYSTAAGYKQNTVGLASDSFSSCALIAPMREDPTKVFVFHIYKAINQTGLDFSVTKTDMAKSPIHLKGYAITTRTPADQLGNFWWQI